MLLTTKKEGIKTMKKQRSIKGYKNIIKLLTVIILGLLIVNVKQYKDSKDIFKHRYVVPGEEITIYSNNTKVRIISDYHNNGDVYTDVITETLWDHHELHREAYDVDMSYDVIQSPYQVKRQ